MDGQQSWRGGGETPMRHPLAEAGERRPRHHKTPAAANVSQRVRGFGNQYSSVAGLGCWGDSHGASTDPPSEAAPASPSTPPQLNSIFHNFPQLLSEGLSNTNEHLPSRVYCFQRWATEHPEVSWPVSVDMDHSNPDSHHSGGQVRRGLLEDQWGKCSDGHHHHKHNLPLCNYVTM